MLPHTTIPNATIAFATIATPQPTGRNARTTRAISVGATTTAETFETGVYIRPVSFGDARARAVVPAAIDATEGQVWAGQWRLGEGVTVPDWVVDGMECSLSFEGKPMSAVFYFVPGRSSFGNQRRLGPELVLQVKRVN